VVCGVEKIYGLLAISLEVVSNINDDFERFVYGTVMIFVVGLPII